MHTKSSIEPSNFSAEIPSTNADVASFFSSSIYISNREEVAVLQEKIKAKTKARLGEEPKREGETAIEKWKCVRERDGKHRELVHLSGDEEVEGMWVARSQGEGVDGEARGEKLLQHSENTRLDHSPYTKANRDRFPRGVEPGYPHVGTEPDNAAGRRILSGVSLSPHPYITTLLYTRLTSSSSALKTLILRTTHTSLLHSWGNWELVSLAEGDDCGVGGEDEQGLEGQSVTRGRQPHLSIKSVK
ncbi:hypothetical protein PR048_022693 [Dryococelus australis]|uniref:Uncharacterized protein n=1 Tax=Dryococelus australis TaxID=614101 RepID=A0ABQ9GRZ2_9NEOP|nr:hypothetical protein PR048_022693 [Dryococelus australis]